MPLHTMQVVGRLEIPYRAHSRKFKCDSVFLQYAKKLGIQIPGLYQHFSEQHIETYYQRKKGVLKYDQQVPDLVFDAQAATFADAFLDSTIGPFVRGWDVLHPDHITTVRSSSPGFPFDLTYFNKGEVYDQHDFDQSWIDLAKPEDYFCLWSCFIKQELLPLDKIAAREARIVLVPPADFAQMQARLSQDFNRRMNSAPKSTSWNMLGFNKFSGGFQTLAQKLPRKFLIHPGDVSAYDAKLHTNLRLCALRFRLRMAKEKSKDFVMRMINMYKTCTVSYILMPDGFVLLKFHGMDSGDINTSNDDSLCHAWFWAYIYCVDISSSLSQFAKQVVLNIYNDDNCHFIHPNVASVWTVERLTSWYKKFGWDYKDAEYHTTLEGVTFLGSKFHKLHDTFVPVGDFEKSLDSLTWPGRNEIPKGFSLLRVIAIYINCFYHPKAYLLRQIIDSYVRDGIKPSGTAKELRELKVHIDYVPTDQLIRKWYSGAE